MGVLFSPQLARLEGRKASLEAELTAANEDLAEMPARVDAAQGAAAEAQRQARERSAQVGPDTLSLLLLLHTPLQQKR